MPEWIRTADRDPALNVWVLAAWLRDGRLYVVQEAKRSTWDPMDFAEGQPVPIDWFDRNEQDLFSAPDLWMPLPKIPEPSDV